VDERERPVAVSLSHLDEQGRARMVDVSAKDVSLRRARAEAWVEVGPAVAARIRSEGGLSKGDVLGTARLAGVMGAKRTAELIPMCHPLPLDHVRVEAELRGERVHIEAEATCRGRTGVEMEAMVAASVAALTVYDMVKAAAKGIRIGPVQLLEKEGGRSGHWQRAEEDDRG